MGFVNFYEVLEIAPSATHEEIERAVRQQRRVWVRRQSSPDPERRTIAETRVRQVDEAEKTLLDRQARGAFDRRLAAVTGPGRREAVGGSAGAPRPDERTDQRTTDPSGTAGTSDMPPPETGEELIDRARGHLSNGNHGPAWRAARQATATARLDVDAWLVRGDAARELGKWTDADDSYAEAVRIRPDSVAAHLGLATVHDQAENWPAAVASYQRAVDLDPSQVPARLRIAEIYCQTDRRDEGRELIEELAERHPDDEVVASALALSIYETTLSQLDRMRNGARLARSRRQVAALRDAVRRIGALGEIDDRTGACLRSLENLLRSARTTIWLPPRNPGLYVLCLLPPLLVALLGALGTDLALLIYGLIPVAVLTWVYLVRHRKPQWRVSREQHAPQVVERGI